MARGPKGAGPQKCGAVRGAGPNVTASAYGRMAKFQMTRHLSFVYQKVHKNSDLTMSSLAL